jgi:hypothetical protein
MTYKAIVAPIRTRPHPNADRLQLGTCLGYQVVVGLDTQDGEIGVFFRSDGQLSEEFAKANDLIRRKDPETGEHKGGFFEENRRVRSQKFRGERSDGFWCPVHYFEFTGAKLEQLNPGDEFDALNGIPICNKYVTPATMRARARGDKATRKETRTFPMHVETDQFRDHGYLIDLDEHAVTITEKVHGTSHRFGYTLDIIRPTWYQRLWLNIGGKISPKAEYTHLSGTRRVILRGGEVGFYKNGEFRHDACLPFYKNLHPGELVFFEIVGWAGPGERIMAVQDTTKLNDKKLLKQYGPTMEYKYGTEDEFDVYVYRIAVISPDGYIIDLPWSMVKERCNQLGVKHVPELYSYSRILSLVNSGEYNDVGEIVEEAACGPSTIDQSHIREGVVVRVDTPTGPRFLKHKSFDFGVLEGYLKESDDYVDMEEAS